MLQLLRPIVVKIRSRFPGLYDVIIRFAKRFLGDTLGVYPRIMGGEIRAITEVLRSSQWNMAYGRGLAHERLEADFAEMTGSAHAIAVASGGVALQMSLRALGLKPGDEAIHQVDTCSATAMAVLNAGVTPIFADIDARTFMLDIDGLRHRLTPATKAIVATHMWGNPENMGPLRTLAHERGARLIEDACLALGAVSAGRPAGSTGDVGVFSFGCIKPIQTGEGGMITTDDESLARELRSLRHWGDRTIEYGVRDTTQLAWNGRMSEILAALAREQLRGYPDHLRKLRGAIAQFKNHIAAVPGIELVLGSETSIDSCAFTQVVIRIDESALGISKPLLREKLTALGIPCWHANFELINSLSFFRGDEWRNWVLRGDLDRVAANYAGHFPTAEAVIQTGGLGLGKSSFLSASNLKYLFASVDRVLAERGRS